jgi:choline-sulfatase
VKPTNILFINSDQHSKRVLGCYGNPVVQTPNLDALAARGTRFANAYCPTPICVPSRASLATGRYAHQIDSWDNAMPYVGTEAPSWGHRLTEQGHKVTTIGKLHYRSVEDPTGFPDQRLPMHVLDGVGDIFQCMRGEMPAKSQRRYVEEAGAGEVEYTRYDRGIAREAVRWLTEEGRRETKPWALFVSFVYPHMPLVAPREYVDRYPPDSLPLPVQWRPEDWARHPALDLKRAMSGMDEPFDEPTIRRAIAAYYGMVTLLDDHVGQVLRALEASGQADTTLVVYSTDHGEQLGDHGQWWKSTMYEGSAGVPLILAGPGVPAGKVVNTNVTLVDCFPTIVEAVGARPAAADADLPGESLLRIANSPDRPRPAFSEYHASYSASGIFMLRTERYKYVHYVGMPPQLFDLLDDPDETRDLASDPAHAATLAACEHELRAICDPDEVDRRARADQRCRLDEAGGLEAVLRGGVKVQYTPAPSEFEPAIEAARERYLAG